MGPPQPQGGSPISEKPSNNGISTISGWYPESGEPDWEGPPLSQGSSPTSEEPENERGSP